MMSQEAWATGLTNLFQAKIKSDKTNKAAPKANQLSLCCKAILSMVRISTQ